MEPAMNSKDRLDNEFKAWEDFLNNVIGVLAFTLAMASIGTNSPSTNAFISMLFLLILMGNRRSLFPAILVMLRAKENRTRTEEESRKSIERGRLGLKAFLRRYSVYVAGWLFLVFVVSLHRLSDFWPSISLYVNG
jgi:hypothetical protein